MADINRWESSNEYDEELSKIEHYKLHPELMPFIGTHYNESGVLLVGESHYCSRIITDADRKYLCNEWYSKETPCDFTDKEYFNTRFVLHNFLSLKRSRAHSMFRNPANSIINALELKNVSDSEAFNICAFMNYFQRPAINTNQSIDISGNDNEFAFKVFREICEIIKPELLLFLSEKAYKSFKSYRDKTDSTKKIPVIESFSHPTCAHWYGEKGKTKFESIIREHVKFSNFSPNCTYDINRIKSTMPDSFRLIEKRQNRFYDNTISFRVYGNHENPSEIVVHTKNNGKRTGVGYVIHHNFIWIWDYDNKRFISTNEIDNYSGLRAMYDEFERYIKGL